MSKFTQGKWFVENLYDVFSDTGDGKEEIFCGALFPKRGETMANARLIAAAPDMYTALTELIPILEETGKLSIAYSLKKLLERIDGSEA